MNIFFDFFLILKKEFSIEYRSDRVKFSCTRFLDQSESQTKCFEALRGTLVHSVLKGRKLSLMFYGQTGAGKTHTMFGEKDGIMYQAMEELFKFNMDGAMKDGYTFSMKMSSFQIYSQTLRDLFNNKVSSKMLQKLKID